MASVVLVYGPKGAGKTTTTLHLADSLVRAGVRVGGFYQRKTCDHLDRRGYELVRFGREENVTLATQQQAPADGAQDQTICSFCFRAASFAQGRQWIEDDAAWAQVLVLDEIGKLEAKGEGHADALLAALQMPTSMLLLSVRADQLYYVVERFGLDDKVLDYLELPADDQAPQELVKRIVQALGCRP